MKTIMDLLRIKTTLIDKARSVVHRWWQRFILFVKDRPLWALFAFVGIISLLFW